MLFVEIFYCGALMLCCSHGQQLNPAHDTTLTEPTFPPPEASSAPTASHHNAPCFVDDIFAALREGVGNDGELTNSSLTQFGICTVSDSSSVLLQLAKETSRNQRNGLEVLHPTEVLLAEVDERGTLTLTFDLAQFPLLKQSPVLLLAFESPLTGRDLDVTFTGQALHPNTQRQSKGFETGPVFTAGDRRSALAPFSLNGALRSVNSVCISGETQYIMLTGKASEGHVHQTLSISVETRSPDMNQILRDILIGGKAASNISMTPLLLLSRERGTETRHTHSSGSSSSHTSFLCELKRFLGEVLPQDHPEAPPLQLGSLNSLPPLTLGLSSSETLLAGLINSSSPTIFSFTGRGSVFQVHHGEMSVSPALLEELMQRLEQTVMQIMEVIREEELGQRATERLGRLRELSAFPKKEPAAGKSQYRTFVLLKALQTVARAYEVQRGLRAIRAGPNNPVTANVCGLRSLTVSLERHALGPNSVNIKNCHGSCAFPLANANNHAVLLNFHIESGNVDERPPCCVPVAYDALEMVDFSEHGTSLSIKPDVVVKECGCR